MNGIRNVYCIGRNYGQHAAELGNAVPEEPMVFLKPTHAIVPMQGQAIRLPAGQGAIHYEAELVVRAGADFEPGMAEADWIDAFAIGIDFTLRDVQNALKSKGYPWLAAKGFRNSAPLGDWRPFPGMDALANTAFSLAINGELRQAGRAADMIFPIRTVAAYISEHFGLRKGDVIFTGTPAGVGPVADGDRLAVSWNGEPAGEFRVRLEA
jgi:2-keto-4-pentenoate hydratase/2-oxohepta-3-ene-1,7-dioic acid hydratase in catechol pathway